MYIQLTLTVTDFLTGFISELFSILLTKEEHEMESVGATVKSVLVLLCLIV